MIILLSKKKVWANALLIAAACLGGYALALYMWDGSYAHRTYSDARLLTTILLLLVTASAMFAYLLAFVTSAVRRGWKSMEITEDAVVIYNVKKDAYSLADIKDIRPHRSLCSPDEIRIFLKNGRYVSINTHLLSTSGADVLELLERAREASRPA